MSGESEYGVTHQHRLPRSRGWGSGSAGASVYCSRCRQSVPVTDEWIRANIRGQSRYGLPDVKVVINDRLTYRWPFPADPQVGLSVLLPGTERSGPWLGVITQIGSDYDGYLVNVMDTVPCGNPGGED